MLNITCPCLGTEAVQLQACEACGAIEELPFKCSYCGLYHCSEHRLPEAHDCSQLYRARAPRAQSRVPYPWEPKEFPISWMVKGAWFSSTEAFHIAAGTLLVLLVGITWRSIAGPLWVIALAAALFAASFIFHEVAHKIVAQNYGLRAEFRINLLGAAITAFSIFSPLKIIAPGAVIISGPAAEYSSGRIALAGPATNIAFAGGFYLLHLLTAYSHDPFVTALSFIFYATAYINSFIAVFNLIPFGILDGAKVVSWNVRVWAVAFAASVGLMLLML